MSDAETNVAMNEGDLDQAINNALDAADDDELVGEHMGGLEDTGEEGAETPTEEPPQVAAPAEEPTEEPAEPAEPEDPADALIKQLAQLDPEAQPETLPEGLEADSQAGRLYKVQQDLLNKSTAREQAYQQRIQEAARQYNETVSALQKQNHEMQVEMARVKALLEAGVQQQQPQQPQVDEYGRPIPQQVDMQSKLDELLEQKLAPVIEQNKKLQEAAAEAQKQRELAEETEKWRQYTTKTVNDVMFSKWGEHSVPNDVRTNVEQVVYSLSYHLGIPMEQAARAADKLFTSYVAEKMRAASRAGKSRAEAMKKLPKTATSGVVAKGGNRLRAGATEDLGAAVDRAFNTSAPPPPDDEGIVDFPL